MTEPVAPGDATGDAVGEPIEIELTSNAAHRRQRRPRTRRETVGRERSYRWLAAALAVAGSGMAGFVIARSTGSEAASRTSADATANSSATSEVTMTATAAAPTTTARPAAATDTTGSETGASAVEDSAASASADELSSTTAANAAATYVGPDRIDSRIAGQPIRIVANGKDGLVDVDISRAGPEQPESLITEFDDRSDSASLSLPIAAAGPDWVMLGDGWEALVLYREGQEPRQLVARYDAYVEFPDGADWGWRFDPAATGYEVHQIDLNGVEVPDSEVPLPSWFGLWLVPGPRLTGVIGGTVFEFTRDGDRPLGNGFPIATGRHTVVVVRCGDQLECDLVSVNLDTGDETPLADSALAAKVDEFQSPSISPDDRYIALQTDDVAVVVDLLHGERTASLPGETFASLSTETAWSNDSRWLFYLDAQARPMVLDPASGERFPMFDPTTETAPWTSLAVRLP